MNSSDDSQQTGDTWPNRPGDVKPTTHGTTPAETYQANTNPASEPTVRFSTTGSPISTEQKVMKYPGVGTVVFRRYCLQRVLGRGGMGIVWLAFDMKLERAVALKFLPDVIGHDSEALKELKDETRRGLDLAHPNIMRIYDLVDDDEAAAISMEFVDGRTLHEERSSRPNKIFSVQELAPWVRELCDALDYAHRQVQIIHRDIKPANLMINSESHLKIADFGIARSLSDNMSRMTNGTTSGTLLFMSPQQAMGERPRPTDDIYSVGSTLYDLITGKPPFYRGDVAMQVASKKPISMQQRREELGIDAPDTIPDQWERAIAACLEKNPSDRPQSAAELAGMLGLEVKADTKPIVVFMRDDTKSRMAAHGQGISWLTRGRLIAASLAAVLGISAFLVSWWTNRPGQWSVETNPPGAFVAMGGHAGLTPAHFDDLKPGRYKVQITLEGYDPRMLEFSVKPGQNVDTGVIRLVRSTGLVSINSDPDGDDFNVKSVSTALVPPQPDVPAPSSGFWNLNEIFTQSEYADFSANGRQFIIKEAVEALQEHGHLPPEAAVQPGAELHKAIQTFQGLNKLKSNGLLDAATCITLQINGSPDKADWAPQSENASQQSWWARHVSQPIARLFGGGAN